MGKQSRKTGFDLDICMDTFSSLTSHVKSHFSPSVLSHEDGSSSLIDRLKQLGLEVVRLWDYAADLIHYEIIELCTAQYIDLLVTSNERLMLPREEWLDYLMPHRTRMLIIPQQKLINPEELAQSIYNYTHIKRKFKTKNQPFKLIKNVNETIKNLEEN